MSRIISRVVLLLLILASAALLYSLLPSGTSPVRRGRFFPSHIFSSLTRREPANSTLGFGAVLAVSREGSPRRESLILAANITEIDLTIPTQPKWTEEAVSHLRADHDSRITRGSALAWLGHLNALRWFLDSDLETVLILEDDVDWDIHLRTVQVPAAAAAIRKLVRDQTIPPGTLEYTPDGNNFWGNHSAWDILYLGHCGDIFRPDQWTEAVPRLAYEDPTLPSSEDMHPFTAYFRQVLKIPETHRVIHKSIFPLCTFGFALTRPAAHRLLNEIAPKEAEGGTMAYDVRILEACRDHGFRCWSANPELFHHLDMESEIASANVAPAEGVEAVAGEADRLKILRQGKAPNIACGARRRRFFTRDHETMEYLRDVVGRQGQCLADPQEEVVANWKLNLDDEQPGDPRMYI